jgi:hypothetical protein
MIELVIPAEAGTQRFRLQGSEYRKLWVPASAGMTIGGMTA